MTENGCTHDDSLRSPVSRLSSSRCLAGTNPIANSVRERPLDTRLNAAFHPRDPPSLKGIEAAVRTRISYGTWKRACVKPAEA